VGSMIVEVVSELFSNSLAIFTKITNSLLNIANFAIAMFATWKVDGKQLHTKVLSFINYT
jgi:Co/Zn/Cd efflux system component